MADRDTEVAALQQALALAQSIGSATSYADLVDLAVRAFDDGVIYSIVLLTHAPASPEGIEHSTIIAGWRRGLDRHPTLGQRFALASADRALRAVPDLSVDAELEPFLRQWLEERGYRACISLPLVLNGALIGTIFLSWLAPQVFTPATLQLAETLMALAPGVAERIQLYEEARAQLEELGALRASLEAQVSEQTAELRTFKAMVDGAIDAMAITTSAGVMIYGNPAFAKLSGFGDAVVGSAITDYFAPDDLSIATTQMMPALLRQGAWQGSLRLQRPDGSFWISQLSAFALRDSYGRTEAMAGLFRDITAERQHAEELQRANQRLEQSFRTSPLATLEADNQGIIRRWNPAAERIFGWSAAEAIGRDAIELLVPGLAREHVEAVVGALLSGEATDARNINITKDGRLITCQWHNAVLRDGEGRVLGWLSQTEDITAQLQAEEEQKRLQEQVIAAQQAALREISTPIIPIGAGVVAMPLIGTIDSQRAQQVIDALLEGVAATRATAAILDITGVQVVDTQVANALLRAAQAVKLLGAEVIITGIRPEVAQTLVGLGVDLRGMTTLATFQSGIAYALQRHAARR